MSAHREEAPLYRPDIDGLRAVAVLAVVAFHAFPLYLPGGFVGVDVFFVISGFLISSIILKGLDQGTFSFRDFYRRRIARIFPALVVVLAASLVLGWFVMLATEYRQLGRHVAAAGAFVANIAFWREAGYFDAAAESMPLLHLWSLGVEEQFYLLWPALLWFAARRRWNTFAVIAIVAAVSFFINVATVGYDRTAAFFLPSSRLWELLLGALLAYASLSRRTTVQSANLKAVVGVAFIAAAYIGVRAGDAFPGWWALLPTVGAALVIAAGPDAWINRHVLARRAPVFIGLISYPLYLWHWPVLSFARLALPELGTMMTGALIATSITLAWLTYVAIEKPIRYGRFVRASWRTPALASAMVVVTSTGIVVAKDGFTTRFNPRYHFLSSYTYDYRNGYRARCHLRPPQTERDFASDCVDAGFGAPGRTSILVWGDSYAAHLYPGLRSLADTMNLSIAQLTADSCEPLIDPAARLGSSGGFSSTDFCARLARFVLDRVLALKPSIVLLASRWSDPHLERVQRTIAALQAHGATRIILVGPVPSWHWALPKVLIQHMRRHPHSPMPERMRFGVTGGPFANEVRLRAALGARGAKGGGETAEVSYVSALDVFCRSGACLAVSDGSLTAWDNAHLTETGSRVLARAILSDPAPTKKAF